MHNTDTMFVEFASYQYLWSAKCYLTQVIFRILCAHRTQLFRLFAILDVYTLDLRRFDFAPRFKCQMFVRGVYSYAWCLCAAYISCVCVCACVSCEWAKAHFKIISRVFKKAHAWTFAWHMRNRKLYNRLLCHIQRMRQLEWDGYVNKTDICAKFSTA